MIGLYVYLTKIKKAKIIDMTREFPRVFCSNVVIKIPVIADDLHIIFEWKDGKNAFEGIEG
jgi:hypothetical protein